MSEYLQKTSDDAIALARFTQQLIEGSASKKEVIDIQEKLAEAGPQVFVSAVDLLVLKNPVTPELKKGISKMLNVFYKHLNDRASPNITEHSFSGLILRDNIEIWKKLNLLKPAIKLAQKKKVSSEQLKEVQSILEDLQKADLHYQIMENVVFPFLESKWPDHRCFQVLWSVHDDVRNELRELFKILDEPVLDLKRFNRLTGDLFFNMKTIIFREEKIILPAIFEAGINESLDNLLMQATDIGWSFITPPDQEEVFTTDPSTNNHVEGMLNFKTGSLLPEQVELIFNHLPVDITFVDEHDTVKYFSTPPKRTFTRTPTVIGRKVQNCHPPESVHIVEEIVEAFRSGDRNEATFWIPFKDQFVLIQYFALRDAGGNYRGTIEVTQDVADIKKLEGERRLLSWSASE